MNAHSFNTRSRNEWGNIDCFFHKQNIKFNNSFFLSSNIHFYFEYYFMVLIYYKSIKIGTIIIIDILELFKALENFILFFRIKLYYKTFNFYFRKLFKKTGKNLKNLKIISQKRKNVSNQIKIEFL
jgi:hypothetical protein